MFIMNYVNVFCHLLKQSTLFYIKILLFNYFDCDAFIIMYEFPVPYNMKLTSQ